MRDFICFCNGNYPENPHPPNLFLKIHPNLGVDLQKALVLQCFWGIRSLNSGGEIFTPQIWVVWVFREILLAARFCICNWKFICPRKDVCLQCVWILRYVMFLRGGVWEGKSNSAKCRGFAKGWFPKGWFWRMFPRNENRNEGTFAKTTLLETTLLSPNDPFWC